MIYQTRIEDCAARYMKIAEFDRNNSKILSRLDTGVFDRALDCLASRPSGALSDETVVHFCSIIYFSSSFMTISPVSVNTRKLWYTLIFEDPQIAERALGPAVSIRMDPSSDWDDFREIFLDKLDLYDKTQIMLYEDEDHFGAGKVFDSIELVGDELGRDKRSPMIVFVSDWKTRVESNKHPPVLGQTINHQPRTVWYILYNDSIESPAVAPAASVPLRPNDLVHDLKIHCTPPNHQSTNNIIITHHIQVYDEKKNQLEGCEPIGDLGTSRETALHVVIPYDSMTDFSQLFGNLSPDKKFEWAPLVPNVSIEYGNLFFVNRVSAVRSLLTICIMNDRKKKKGTAGTYSWNHGPSFWVGQDGVRS